MAFTFWQRFRPNLYLAAVVIAFVLWSATLPSAYSAGEVQTSALLILVILAGYLVGAAVVCVSNQARFERRMRETQHFTGRAVSSRWTVCGMLNFALGLAAVIWFASFLYGSNSKLTVDATRTEMQVRR